MAVNAARSLRTDADVLGRAILVPGTAVEVRSRFVERWVHGFEVAEVLEDPAGPRYRLLRSSDRTVLPEVFGLPEVRPDPRYAPGGWQRPTAATL